MNEINRKDHVAEIVGGLELKDLVEHGADIEFKCIPPDETDLKEDEEYTKELQQHLKFECIHVEEAYEGQEPFAVLAETMENVLPDGKIKKKIIREGYGAQPEESTTVNLHYNGYIEFEAQPFDSTYARKKPFAFKIGEGEVIEGLEMAVRSMKINEKAQFLIDSELAYRGGVLGRIPPDTEVLFVVELYDVHTTTKEDAPEVDQKEFENAYKIGVALRIKANNMVKSQDYQSAIKTYKSAVDKVEDAILRDYNDQLKSEQLLVMLYTNLLVTCCLAKIPKRGCIFAQKIYEMSKSETFNVNAKVYFNHAKCVKMLGDFDRALRLLSRAKKLEPKNSEILKEINALKECSQRHKQHEKNLGKALVKS